MPTLIYISLNSCEIQHLFIYLFICHLDFCFHELIVYIIYSVAYPILLLILSVFYIVIMPILSFILLQVSSTCLWLFFFQVDFTAYSVFEKESLLPSGL